MRGIGLGVALLLMLSSATHAQEKVKVKGVIWNDRITTESGVEYSLLVKNVTRAKLYVPSRFNSQNYTLQDELSTSSCHADAPGASFPGDFAVLEPDEILLLSYSTGGLETPGRKHFSVSFYSNLSPETRTQLARTRIGYIVELAHDFGQILIEQRPKKPLQGAGAAILERKAGASSKPEGVR